MIYCTSDLHGSSLNKFRLLLNKAGFGENDYLYILGDIIDRGEYGTELLEWIMTQRNIQLLLGNHETMLLCCSFLFDEITEESLAMLDSDKIKLYYNWIINGGGPTLKMLQEEHRSDPEIINEMLDFLRDASVYETVSAGGRSFLLCHAGIENFSPDKEPRDYENHRFLWNRPKLSDYYYENMITIFGHTPTFTFGEEYAGKIIRTDTWIDIDTGVSHGYPPCLLRLEDLEEFYI